MASEQDTVAAAAPTVAVEAAFSGIVFGPAYSDREVGGAVMLGAMKTCDGAEGTELIPPPMPTFTADAGAAATDDTGAADADASPLGCW